MDISIIIPVKNGQQTLAEVLGAIRKQVTKFRYEIIVIDSGSTDDTLTIASNNEVRLHTIPPEEFSHSKTRNLGAFLAKSSRYLIFINQDAVPSDEYWLDNMVRSIEFEPGIKAACAMELDSRGRYFNVSGVAAYLFRNSSIKGVYIIEPYLQKQNADMPGELQRKLFPFSTVCAIFEKDHFDRYPFDERVDWGEDLYWAVHNSRLGFKSACSSLAKVYHHHDYSPKEFHKILEHTLKIYGELFGIKIDPLQPGKHFELFYDCPTCASMQKSLSWRITKPIRVLFDYCRRVND